MDHLPLALLARGTQRDLDEVFRIATRSGMRLHLTDYHLAMARLHNSREHFLKAEALIAATGYHRRDAELEALRHSLES
jgi:lysine/ornithine N-monooxygenase